MVKVTLIKRAAHVAYTNETMTVHTIMDMENKIGHLEDVEVDGRKVLTGFERNKV